jgi:c-di-GMP-binding flagellar brake protein YcgR
MDNRRRHTRFGLALAAEVEIDGHTLSGETRDLSEGGVSVILERTVPEQSEIALTLILTEDGIEDADEDPFTTRASVIWAAPTDDGQCMLGLRFAAVAQPELARLKRFLAALAQA